MSLPVILRPDAEDDLETTRASLELIQTGLGIRFLARVRETLERIESMPELYGIIWNDVRAARLKRFRYIVYYVTFPDRVEVLAVLHGSRDPSVWQSRE